MTMQKTLLLAVIPVLLGASLSAGNLERKHLSAVLEREIPRLMKEADIPGLSMAVVCNGQICWSKAFGVRNRETNDPVDENTMFEAASLTKPVTAYAALRLVDQGRLGLDRPLHEYFPGQKYDTLANDEKYKNITARMVLTHTTGLPNWGTRFLREPGKLFGYSGEGFLYLGRTIEQISGRSLQDFAKKEIFDPLAMVHTSYIWNETYAANGASGHDRHGYPNGQRKNTEPNGAASLLTTARDYAAFLCAIINGQGLKKETAAQMLSPQVKATKWRTTEPDDHIMWGWGWGIQPGDNGLGYWHWGDNGDLRAYTVTYRDLKMGYVYFTNSENGLSIVEAVSALVFARQRPQYFLEWFDFEQYNDPKRLAKLAVEKAFLIDGKEAGRQKLREAQGKIEGLFSENSLLETADYLSGKGKGEEAVTVYEICLESFPESIKALTGLGTLYMGLGQNQAAAETFSKALNISPENALAKLGVQWADEARQADIHPVDLTEADMARLAGDYGPRHITLREGRLYYRREGRLEYRLKPLSASTFSLEGSASFRIRFVSDDRGEVQKIIGLYLDGSTDESLRDRSQR
jgi:CubicO group peptidase (beta-lactamase class C family)